MYDSQNNANGGYNIGDDCIPACSDANNNYDNTRGGSGSGIPYYYVGSVLYVGMINNFIIIILLLLIKNELKSGRLNMDVEVRTPTVI